MLTFFGKYGQRVYWLRGYVICMALLYKKLTAYNQSNIDNYTT